MHVYFFFQSVISLKGGQLVQVQKWDGKETTIVREIKGSNMIMVRVLLNEPLLR